MAERWLTVDEISIHLGVSKKTVYNWLSKGKIPAHKLAGKVWRFKVSEVDAWVTESSTKSKKNEKWGILNDNR